jgi:hypothetical protein
MTPKKQMENPGVNSGVNLLDYDYSPLNEDPILEGHNQCQQEAEKGSRGKM